MRIRQLLSVALMSGLVWACVPATSGGGNGGGDNANQGGDPGPGNMPMTGGAGTSQGNALGVPCAQSDDCQSGVCASLGELQFCTEACAGDGDCPEGFACQLNFCIPNEVANPPSGGNMMGPRGGEPMGPSGGRMPPPQGGEPASGGAPGAGGQPAAGGAPAMPSGPLCGEEDPGRQCRVACIRLIDCMSDVCPHEPPNAFVGQCQAECPNQSLIDYVCAEGRACENIVSTYTEASEILNDACYVGQCTFGECGARGRCVDGVCQCALGYTGWRCDTPPTADQRRALCAQYVGCVTDCEDPADRNCRNACANEYPAGESFFSAFSACLVNNGCIDENQQIEVQCAVDLCPAEVQNCTNFGQ